MIESLNQLGSKKMLHEMFHSELEVSMKTSHPHIMRVNEVMEDKEFYYIDSELLKGGEILGFIQKMQDKSPKEREQYSAYICKQLL